MERATRTAPAGSCVRPTGIACSSAAAVAGLAPRNDHDSGDLLVAALHHTLRSPKSNLPIIIIIVIIIIIIIIIMVVMLSS